MLDLDLHTVVVLNAVGMMLLGLGLLVAVRDYLGKIPGVKRWTAATLLQAFVWTLFFFRGTMPDILLGGIGACGIGLASALYYHALVEFTRQSRPVRWVYGLAGLNAILVAWFVLVVPHIGWRIVVVSLMGGTLLGASGLLLLRARGNRNASAVMTASVFVACSAVMLLRAVYFLTSHMSADRSALASNPVQGIAFLMFFIAGIVLTFGFLLMCNERHSEENRRLALVAEHTSAAVLIGGPGDRIEWVNSAFTRLTGYAPEEVIGRHSGDFLRGAETDPAVVARVRTAVAQNRGADEEEEHYRKDGTPYWVRNRMDVVLDGHGQPSHYVSVHTDITERKRAEEEIGRFNAELEQRVTSRTAQLENANRELEAFSYSVAHDLRTPLSSIDGFSHLLEPMVSSERGKHYLERIRAGAKHMGELTQALLSLSRITRSSLRWENVNLTETAHGVLANLREQDPDRGVIVDVKPGMKMVGDPHLLLQVMDNLIGNAWKFTARRDPARIEVGCDDGPGKEAVYFVRDNGAGFDMAHATKLFAPFERLHTPGDYAGTGIGLATVHRILARHGGRVWAVSAPEAGAAFHFTLGMPPA